MSSRRILQHLAASALFALGVSLAGAQTAESAKGKAPVREAKGAAESAKDRAKAGPNGVGLSELVKQLKENRAKMVSGHDELAKQLKDATEQEKKAIKEKMERQMKAFEEQQATLHKQIRDEQRRQRTVSPKR